MARYLYIELEIEGVNKSATVELFVNPLTYYWQLSTLYINGTITKAENIPIRSVHRWHELIRKCYPDNKIAKIFDKYIADIKEQNAIDEYESPNY